MKKKIEIACFSPVSARTAIGAGADRIEFCSDYKSGGVTPSVGDFIALKKCTLIPIYVMIRSRPGNFVYSADEIKQMKSDILLFKDAGADGFVFGVLDHDNTVNEKYCCELLDAAGGLPCTFHRAFDKCLDLHAAAETIALCGFTGILSSGKAKTAAEGAGILSNLIARTEGKISFIAGGGVRSKNIEKLCRDVETEFYHSSGIVEGGEADRSEIEKMIQILKKCSD